MAEPDPEAAAEPAASPWTIVTQVKSNRVVYFTDDPSYEPLMDGDWYYVSVFHEALPKGMTLRNCWRWRFTGGRFTDAATRPALPPAESLMEANRKALHQILTEKIDAIRAPFAPACHEGEQLRAMKRDEARAFLALPEGRQRPGGAFSLLESVALARRCSLSEAAHLLLAKEAEQRAVLLASERYREQFARLIDTAATQPALLEIREWLLDKVYPELSHQFRHRVIDTEPVDLDAPLPEAHRRHEIGRLKAELREAINRARQPLHSDYIRNDELRRHKLRLARIIAGNLAAGQAAETAPAGMTIDFGPLHAYAEGRGLPLAEAVEVILRSAELGDALLDRTERVKDRLLAKIEAVKTLQDIRTAAKEINEAAAEERLTG